MNPISKHRKFRARVLGPLGALSVLVTRELGPWLGVALFVVAAAFLLMRYWYDASERGDPGYTTEIAGLCTVAVGACVDCEID